MPYDFKAPDLYQRNNAYLLIWISEAGANAGTAAILFADGEVIVCALALLFYADDADASARDKWAG